MVGLELAAEFFHGVGKHDVSLPSAKNRAISLQGKKGWASRLGHVGQLFRPKSLQV